MNKVRGMLAEMTLLALSLPTTSPPTARNFANVGCVIIDEISMVSTVMLVKISERLCQIKGNREHFGGLGRPGLPPSTLMRSRQQGQDHLSQGGAAFFSAFQLQRQTGREERRKEGRRRKKKEEEKFIPIRVSSVSSPSTQSLEMR